MGNSLLSVWHKSPTRAWAASLFRFLDHMQGTLRLVEHKIT